jgi:hypothetical protein
MIGTRTSLIVATAALLCATRPLIGQAPAAAQHPIFAGTWTPDGNTRAVGRRRRGRRAAAVRTDVVWRSARYPQRVAGTASDHGDEHRDVLAGGRPTEVGDPRDHGQRPHERRHRMVRAG